MNQLKEEIANLKEKIDEKLPKKTQKILLYVIGVLVLLIVGLCVFRPIMESNTKQKTNLVKLEGQVSDLKEMDANKAANQKKTKTMNMEISDILSQYPKNVFTEDMLMVFTNLESETGIKITDIEIENTNLVTENADKTTSSDATSDTKKSNSSSDSSSSKDAGTTSNSSSSKDAATTSNSSNGESSDTNDYKLYVTPVSCSFEVSYLGVKQLFASVLSNPLKKNIESIVLSFNEETGNLMGTMVVNFYTIEGDGVDMDVREVIPEINKGTANIFHSL